jgi:hypothetical protein
MTPAQFWQIEMQNQQNQQAQQQQQMNQVFEAAGALAGQYAENKALDAKGAAYGDFLKSHGEQLGFQGEYLDNLLKKKPRELAMIGDQIIGLGGGGGGNRMMSLNHLNQQAALYPRSGAGGGGGSQKGYMPGQGWMGY